MAYRRKYGRKGFGDFSDPSCTPGDPGCVPHWYCYIPLMATPDCLASFSEGVKEIAGGTASAVGGVVGAAAKGVVTGAVDAATGNGNNPSGSGIGFGTVALIAGVGLLGVLAFSAIGGGSPRRYGR